VQSYEKLSYFIVLNEFRYMDHVFVFRGF